MEFETYESELADYSLQDSPFYEASTPIIFNLSTTSAAANLIARNGATSMADALNLSSKKSSMLMSAKCQTFKYERDRFSDCTSSSSNDEQFHKHNGNNNLSSIKNCEQSNGIYSKVENIDLNDSNSINNGNNPTKKKRKCVTFLPNYVQVNIFIIHQSSSHFQPILNNLNMNAKCV